MTFTKYVALMLLGFALFVGYEVHADNVAKQCRCSEMLATYYGSIGKDNVTGGELNGQWHGYVALCSPTFEQPTH